ncbi:hypothetical protein HZS_1677 [Henneguya salminicola]|nr:hypothetical protein HZS_1677 [Henneguya salminicola]
MDSKETLKKLSREFNCSKSLVHECEYCDIYFENEKFLESHVKLNHIYTCAICEKSFPNQNSLNIHHKENFNIYTMEFFIVLKLFFCA